MADTQPFNATRFKAGDMPWNSGVKGYRNFKNSEKRIDRNNPLFLDSLRPGFHHCGVYAIIHKSSGKIYIGSSVAMGRRLLRHRNNFKKKECVENRLIAAFLESPSEFEFSVIEYTSSIEEARSREQFWINFYRSHIDGVGYNASKSSLKNVGVVSSPSVIERRRQSMIAGKKKCVKVQQLDDDGSVIKTFESLKSAGLEMGHSYQQISKACNGMARTAYGYKWRHA